ncbi:hypothetical protein A1Q2_02815 [Trichosporon asahii var. asahii CBS 8904]|uniref:Cytochrome c oxidase subunit n=2 Tax=Trichosporon asahii var. asahii TaxID=189963 RepID=K1VQG3_TRIAC|nr:hypothetical protein A1Q1_07131 [Trichosporon asahii var. asahii CBS 2479]EJT51719.1 hypothetical protein A1Q1_07131 [Trichosporon asahii var. asahii CBS 2479]EKD02871.1 hypothetical protein A1Q2_02815 [Trichosporon asahii var. asahii CBS 8904]
MSEEKTYTLQTAGFDARFPNQNQTKHCHVNPTQPDPVPRSCLADNQQNFVDFHKCVNAKGEDFQPCQQFKRAYMALCPNEWTNKWDEQLENGTFPASVEP